MKRVMVFAVVVGFVAPALAQTPPPAVQGQAPAVEVAWNDAIPPGTPEHVARALKESSRHGEYANIKLADGSVMNSWVVYPERSTKSGVVVVIHDIGGLSDWARALGDQLAQDGFIAIVPDLVSGKGPDGGGAASLGTGVRQAIMGLPGDEVNARLNAAMEYGRTLPASNGKTGVVGFCWGGSRSFGYAIHQAKLDGAVVYYGDVPGATAAGVPEADLAKVVAPVIAMYGGDDARINASVPSTLAAMKKLNKRYEPHTFEGAGHGFLGRQNGANGANLKAAQQAWPLTLAFFRERLK